MRYQAALRPEAAIVTHNGVMISSTSAQNTALKGVRVLTLALNLPGPAAVMRLQAMGAKCTKLEPLAPAGMKTADPMGIYKPTAYEVMHQGLNVLQANL